MRELMRGAGIVLLSSVFSTVMAMRGAAQAPLDASMVPRLDKATEEVLKKTGAPSASIAVVKDGRVVFTHAYGKARLDPPLAAAPGMRYSIGSISKQFTASAIL